MVCDRLKDETPLALIEEEQIVVCAKLGNSTVAVYVLVSVTLSVICTVVGAGHGEDVCTLVKILVDLGTAEGDG